MPTYNTPQYPIIKAVRDLLTGLSLPVHTTVPKSVEEYILISQPTLDEGRASAACTVWEATLLVTVFTKFKQADNVSISRALLLSDEVMGRFHGQTLDLDTFSSSQMRSQRLSMPQKSDGTSVYVQDVIRLRFQVFSRDGVVKLASKSLNDYTPAEVLTYDKLDQLGPLNCPVAKPAPDVLVLRFPFKGDSQDSFSVTLGQDEIPTRFTRITVTGGTASFQVDGTPITGQTWVGVAGQTLTVTRLTGNPTAKAVYDPSL